MAGMVNFGIDLGTTNSLIARFVQGTIEVYKNPTGFKETLPSVVSFRKERIRVGDKAKEFLSKDPRDVFGGFKRKMGTAETFKVSSFEKPVSPIDLSAYVLKELRTFIHSGETVEHAVITIPASFDTIQSNATKEAGIQAGFKTVDLLQEPIAASLAYANKAKENPLQAGQWLVYDLGGGTFDVALVKIQNGEMKIVDHEGDNFLGGSDFDQAIVEKIVIPHLERSGKFEKLESSMKSAEGKYNKYWHVSLHKAEAAKVELTSKNSSEIEIHLTDDNDEEIDVSIPITKTELEGILKESIHKTVDMVRAILSRNKLTSTDLQFVLMVGGSTLIPYVRRRVGELLQIPVNCDIDPTTAIVMGAAYYAGIKPVPESKLTKSISNDVMLLKMVYAKTSQDSSEYFSAKVTGPTKGRLYRITRDDGGFDSGLKSLTERINEDLLLVADSFNFFRLSIFEESGSQVQTNADVIGIAHGKYSIAGQPVPHDICLEIDDVDNQGTKLEVVFEKNSILPLRKTITRTSSRTILKGAMEDVLHINILEGSGDALPESNLRVGYMQIDGRQLPRDVLKGADIEITLLLSESRDLTIKVYIPMVDREFTEVFKPSQRVVPAAKLITAVSNLCEEIESNLKRAETDEDYLTVKILKEKQKIAQGLLFESQILADDDVTDTKYQIDDQKRKLAQELDDITKKNRVKTLKSLYTDERNLCASVVKDGGNDHEKHVLDEIISQEKIFLTSDSLTRIREKTEYLRNLRLTIYWRTPGFLVNLYRSLVEEQGRFNSQEQARIFIEAGKYAVANENYANLANINNELLGLLPNQGKEILMNFTGIS